MDRVVLEDELAELEQIHRKLDENIRRSYTNYLDDSSLGKLKQEKLSIRRSIENIKSMLNNLVVNVPIVK